MSPKCAGECPSLLALSDTYVAHLGSPLASEVGSTPASGGGGERPVTVAVHLIPALAQGGITLGGREDPGLRGDPALLLNPVGARPAPGLVRLERVLHRAGGGQLVGQHHGVLH